MAILMGLLLVGASAWAGSTVPEALPAADRQCTRDEGCTVVMTACCSCTFAAVAVDRQPEVRSRIEDELSCSEVCSISCPAPAVACVGGLCELVGEPESGSHGEEE